MAIIEVRIRYFEQRLPGFVDTDQVSAATSNLKDGVCYVYITGCGDHELQVTDPDGSVYKQIFYAKTGHNEPMKCRLE